MSVRITQISLSIGEGIQGSHVRITQLPIIVAEKILHSNIRLTQLIEVIAEKIQASNLRITQISLTVAESPIIVLFGTTTADSLNFWIDSAIVRLLAAEIETLSDTMTESDNFAFNLAAGGSVSGTQPRVCVIT